MRRILYSFFALSLIFSGSSAVHAATLTETQIQNVINLLNSYGTDANVVNNIRTSLRTQLAPANSTSASTNASSSTGAPIITSVTPATAMAGISTSFVINGRNFGYSGTTVHYTNTTTGNSGTITPGYIQGTEIVFAAVPSTAGTITFYVKNASGQSEPKQVTITSATPTALSPVITSVLPATASVGQTTTFTISGTNFANASVHYTNTTTGNSGTITPTSVSATSLSFSATPSSAGIISFYLKGVNGQVSERKTVTIGTPTSAAPATTATAPTQSSTASSSALPAISSLSHSSATTRTVVTIYGTNLVNPRSGESSVVTFLRNGTELGGIPADHSVSTNTSLVFAIEEYNIRQFAGATHIFIRHGGLSNSPKSQTVSFSIPAPAPTITSVSPTSASTGQTTTFTITGTNFSDATVQYTNTTTGNSGVLTPTSSSATSLSFSATPSSAGIIYFNVKNSDGKTSERKVVTIASATTAAPVISVTPASASIAFGSTASFQWNVTPTAGTTCYAAGNGIDGGSDAINTSGSWTTPKLYANTSYGIGCTNAGGTTYKYVAVTVAQRTDVTTPTSSDTSVSAPVINLTSPSSSNPSIGYGGTVTFAGTVTPTSGTACYAAGTGINGTTGSSAISLSGTWTTPKLYTNTTYIITCTGSTGLTTTKYISVSVAPQTSVTTPPPSISSISPSTAMVGQSTTLIISGANFSGAVIDYTNPATGYTGTITPTTSSANSLSLTATPSAVGTIIFSVRNRDGQISGSSTLTIVPAQGASVLGAFKSLFSK
jgi:hypothetical protein